MFESLKGKKIVLGVTASIAAYKSAMLVREFVKAGADVKVVMTRASKEFITPLTLSTLSKNPVHTKFTVGEEGVWNSHVDLGLWADLMIIAPVSANTLGKMANGLADNLLVATYLSAKCPVYFAPAMDLDMYKHPSTHANIEKLKSFGHTFIDANFGELASGLIGEGRMAEPIEIIEFLDRELSKKKILKGKRILITAGPTYENIDPVRFIGNHSSGLMGIEIAKTCQSLGAEVYLILGPTNLKVDNSNVKVINVQSADQMYNEVMNLFDSVDAGIYSAAVADYKVANTSDSKIKKSDTDLVLNLTSNKDILLESGKRKKHQKIVGFALETDNEFENAKAKIQKKNLDFIVLNSLKDKGAGFKTKTNKITIIDKDFLSQEFELKSKNEVSKDIVNKLISIL
jgi:phosphopantothenoylcysteine decarboxylase/phosphopantothenate--cysteine ligase